MEHPGKITTRTEAIEYILRKRCGRVPSMEGSYVRETLEEQSTEWLLTTANRALDITVERAEKRKQRRASQPRADR